MKIIAFNRPAARWPQSLADALADSDVPDPSAIPATLIADSAVVRPATPLFVPDFATEGWTLRLFPAIVIERLGKSIEPRFAARYTSSWRMAARLMPASQSADTPLQGISAAFDGAIALGPEISGRPSATADIRLTHPSLGSGSIGLHVDAADFHIDETIALASRFMTLKTSDLILPCYLPPEVAPTVGSRLTAESADGTLLSLKIR